MRVESEIRSCSARGHIEMPAAYWAGKMTLEQIFGELQAHDNAAVSVAARHPMHAVQRFIILDSVPDLLTAIDGWLIASGAGDAQQLRFLAHLVLFMRQIGRMPGDVDVADRCIKAYVECLIGNGADASLVAFYTAAVPVELQTVLYGRYVVLLLISILYIIIYFYLNMGFILSFCINDLIESRFSHCNILYA